MRFSIAVLAAFWLLGTLTLIAGETPLLLKAGNAAKDLRGRDVQRVELENRSGKPIAAYVIRFVIQDEAGKVLWERSATTMTAGLGLPKARPSFQPGEKWVDEVRLQGEGNPSDWSIDLIVFDDDTTWGPNQARRLDAIRGVSFGAKAGRTR